MTSSTNGSVDQMSALDNSDEKRSVYWKTRICAKWRDGNCQFGDKCRYAHGEQELRVLPHELVEQLELEKQWKDGLGDNLLPEEQYRHLRELLRKTRLCDKYMDGGSCPYGPNCNFAHGQNELRQAPAGALEKFRQLQQQYAHVVEGGLDGMKSGGSNSMLLKGHLQAARSPTRSGSLTPAIGASKLQEGRTNGVVLRMDEEEPVILPGDELQPDPMLDNSTDVAVLQSRIADMWRALASLRDHTRDLSAKKRTLQAHVLSYYNGASAAVYQMNSALEELGQAINVSSSAPPRKRRTTDA